MPDEPRFAASPQYALGQWERALRQASAQGDARSVKWAAVVSGMADGTLSVGSRTPVADTPAWVTLEVVHGGFATGRYLAELGLDEDEQARLAALPKRSPGSTDRERLNLWYLSEQGQAELLAALRGESYRVDLPEEAALMVVAWLLDHGRPELALDLVSELRPLLHRLRLTPRLRPSPRPSGALVRLKSVGEVRESLQAVETRPQLAAMRETLRVWHPLYDRLVALWCETVENDWPCRVWPPDWADRRRQWLADYEEAGRTEIFSNAHRHPGRNFARLRSALEVCEVDSAKLSGRDVGWIRVALANTITKHGAPGSETRAALRAGQAVEAARPTHAAFAELLDGRLDRYPGDGGVPSLDPLTQEVAEGESRGIPAGRPIPPHLLRKVVRALEAPVETLVERGVIGSGEVLAKVLPQLTSRLLAANLDDPELGALYGQAYAAFRRRRGLLLLNLEHQVRFEELPWIGALEPFRTVRANTAKVAEQTLRQTTLIALSAFPQAILPNLLVREMGALATQAGLKIPLVEEVAADIFMGTFTLKWRRAAVIASEATAGTLYARYYDLPEHWPDIPGLKQKFTLRRWGKGTAEDFADLCVSRAGEARRGKGKYTATNGTVLEQSQILTTHNLAALVKVLSLEQSVRDLAPELADRTLAWVVRRQGMRVEHRYAALQMIKNVAYAWRQAIFFLGFCDAATQKAAVTRLRELVDGVGLTERFGPAVDGLAQVVDGGRFTPAGEIEGLRARRFLGWSVGPHPFLPAQLACP
ncbi:hypothetical protein [Amycolatopsis sp. H20-H5]|uniref:hypothetical protein n=1 Tax=Amycolatopsis sp. H20-H5 TaxID=3046309 RepID=UPI002DBEB651|nr:hypothetical protein [Amycolatopsis sp. H20-H5]MEC3981813.1 hypothetical protein [Amycolatopsis sp. H20-H5]